MSVTEARLSIAKGEWQTRPLAESLGGGDAGEKLIARLEAVLKAWLDRDQCEQAKRRRFVPVRYFIQQHTAHSHRRFFKYVAEYLKWANGTPLDVPAPREPPGVRFCISWYDTSAKAADPAEAETEPLAAARTSRSKVTKAPLPDWAKSDTELSSAAQALAQRVEKLLNLHYAQKPIDSYEARMRVAAEIRAILDAFAVSLLCPKCGEPCSIRAHSGPRSVSGVFSYGHGSRTTHGGSTVIESFRVIPRI